MVMNVKPVPTLDERINDIRMRTAAIINEEILPNERTLWRGRASGADEAERKESKELREHVKARVKQDGLWAPHLPT
jgi:acyl-CoA dehydrogenase